MGLLMELKFVILSFKVLKIFLWSETFNFSFYSNIVSPFDLAILSFWSSLFIYVFYISTLSYLLKYC